MKGCTTIEQSKKLIELGIDVDTADMSYRYTYCLLIDGEPKEDWLLEPYKPFDECGEEQLPCWSTEALLNILDETIVTDNDYEYRLNFGKDGTSYYMYYKDAYRSMNSIIDELDFSCSTLLNCAFEMIVKLKELKLI